MFYEGFNTFYGVFNMFYEDYVEFKHYVNDLVKLVTPIQASLMKIPSKK